MTSRRILLILLVCSLLTSACLKQAATTLSELLIVRAEIVKKFGEEVNVNVSTFGNETTLIVTFINSSLNEKNQDDRSKRAQETAEIARLHYPQSSNLSRIMVAFIKQVTFFAVFHQSNTIDLFAFDRDAHAVSDLGDTTSASNSSFDLETNATYSERSNTSDISVRGLQLEGTPSTGVMLIPHFTVPGNASEKKSKAPAFVSFDFASYVEPERYNGEVIFNFFVDGNRVISTQGRFTHSKPPAATVQFCYLKIPYKDFLRTLGGKSLTIKVDETSYELTPEQFDTLKKMTTYVN